MIGEQLPLIGVIAEGVQRPGELVAGGVGAGHQQARHQHAQFFEAEAIAAVLNANQLGDQIVGQRVPTSGDHVVDVGVHRVPGGEDGGYFRRGIPTEGLEELVGPVGEQLPVLGRSSEKRADDGDRILAGDVIDHVAVPLTGVTVNEFGDDVGDGGAQ